MISSLRGRAQYVGTDSLVVEVGGVGLSVAVAPHRASSIRLGDDVFLHTALIVREDALSLFGFDSRAELDVFTVLLGVSGVGPKSALGVLSHLSVDQIAAAVADDDDAPFRRVSGIGPKTAKLIVVQLAGKLAPPSAAPSSSAPAPSSVIAQVSEALVGLGWPERVATEAATTAADDAGGDGASMQVVLRTALAALGPARQGADRG